MSKTLKTIIAAAATALLSGVASAAPMSEADFNAYVAKANDGHAPNAQTLTTVKVTAAERSYTADGKTVAHTIVRVDGAPSAAIFDGDHDFRVGQTLKVVQYVLPGGRARLYVAGSCDDNRHCLSNTGVPFIASGAK